MKRLLAVGVSVAAVLGCTTTSGALTPSQPTLPAANANVRQLTLSADTGQCIGSPQDRKAVLEIPDGLSFYSVFPREGATPELEGVKTPLWVVVYSDGWPGPTTGLPNRRLQGPADGTWDVCVQRTDGGTIEGLPFIVYGSVPQEGANIAAP